MEAMAQQGSESEKEPSSSKKLIQKQLVLLLHSHACLRKDAISANRPQCPVKKCLMMREVWIHIKKCQVGADCPHPHCLSSLKILAHWRSCEDTECVVCKLVRIKGAQQLQLQRTRRLLQGGEYSTSRTPIPDDNGISPNYDAYDPDCMGHSTEDSNQGLLSQCQGQRQPGNNELWSCITYCDSSRRGSCSHNVTTLFSQFNQSSIGNCKHEQKHNSFHHVSSDNDGEQLLRTFENEEEESYHNDDSDPSFARETPIARGSFNEMFCPLRPGTNNAEQNELSSDDNYPEKETPRQRASFLQSRLQVQIPSINNSRRRPQAEAISPSSSYCSSPQAPSLPVPTAEEVRQAYEMLGIPCPPVALHRLMATLPGGNVATLTPSQSDDDDIGLGSDSDYSDSGFINPDVIS